MKTNFGCCWYSEKCGAHMIIELIMFMLLDVKSLIPPVMRFLLQCKGSGKQKLGFFV